MADISSIKLPDNSLYDIKAKKIFYTECATASNVADKVIECEGFVLEKGAVIAIKFTNTSTTANPTSGNISFNINETGAKNITIKDNGTTMTYAYGAWFRSNRTNLFIYNGTYFIMLNYDANTTYNPMTLGFGYGTCTTAEATVTKIATLASYALVKNGIVSIKFTYAVPANATLNINNRGAKAIYYRGAKITADVIDKGDIATFVYDGANYQLLTVDSNTVYSNATASVSGLMSAEDKAKLDSIENNANNYAHPTYTSQSSGLYKITVDNMGHISNVASVSKSDITALGIPSTDTTYNVATTTTNGLMSATDKKKLDSISSSSNSTVDLLFEGTLSSSSAQLTYSKVSQYKTIIIASSMSNYSILGVISSFPAPAQSNLLSIPYSNGTVGITIREISGNSSNMSYSLSSTSALGTVRIWGFKI